MADPKIRITADTSQAERAINNLNTALEDLNSQAADVAKFFGVLSAAAATVAYTIVKTVDAAGALTDAAKLLNVSTGQLQQLHYAAQLAGVGADEFNGSLVRLNRNLGEGIAKGSGPAVDAMNRLGLNLQQISGLNPDQQFKRIAEELAKIPNYAERSALAMDLFGKQGPRILAVADELEKVRSISEQIGFGVSDREIAALDEASDALDQLKIIWDQGIKKAVAEIAPYVVAIVNEIKRAIAEAGGFEAIWGKITEAIRSVVNVMLIIGSILVGRLVVGALAFTVQLGKALVTARGLSAVLARTPIGLLAVAAGILAEKFGVDLVGGAGEFLDINLDIAAAQKQIDQALADHNAKINSNTEAQGQFNEEQKKALTALDDVIKGQERQLGFLQDTIKFGEQEAQIRKAIADEQAKLLKVGIDLSNDEVNTRLRVFEANLRNEKSLQNQIAYQRQLGDALINAYNLGLPAIDKAQQELRDFDALLSGKRKEQIDQERRDRILADKDLQELARINLQNKVNSEINAVISKNNAAWKIETEYTNRLLELDHLLNKVRRDELQLTETQHRALLDARALAELEYTTQQIKAAQAQAQQIYNATVSRIEAEMFMEAQLSNYRISEKDREMLYLMNQEEKKKQMIAERLAFEKKTDLERVQFGIDQGQVLFAALGKENKKAFEASKALAIASAVMNTYQGATKALATYPWPFGLIAAAAAVAAGFAQVNAIKAQQYSGRALGGPVTGNNTYLVGERGPELFSPNTNGTIIPNNQLGGGGTTNVNFTIVANDTAGFDELLTSRRGVITQIISDAMLERGQRM